MAGKQCAALTETGKQCRNTARGSTKYCASHKGYQPPASRGRKSDTKPSGRGIKDTAPALRKAVRKAEDPSVGPGFVATLLQPERDYLVVYEEPDPDGIPTDDGLLLDIDAGQPVSLGEVDLEQKLDLELSNNTNWVGRLGFVLAILGAIIGAGACAMFAWAYPDPWYTTEGELATTSLIPGTVLVGVIAALTMLAGVVLTHYGRRIQAKGNLSRMRIVEKAFQPRVALGDEYAQQ